MIQITPGRKRRKLLKVLGIIVLVPIALVAAYIAYIFMNYHRLPDSAEQHSQNITKKAALNQEYSLVSWNVGFGAYNRDFSFFMDGGEESRGRSPEVVYDNLGHMAQVIQDQGADHILLQEVDTHATRSWYINELDFFRASFPNDQSYFVRNYNSPYFLLPLKQPHGSAESGLVTLTDLDIYRGERKSLPVETGPIKVLDLDRCYSITRIPTEDGRQLCLYNLHLSAYTSDGTIATEQLRQLLDDMQSEYYKDNYVVAGGDFNKDLVGFSNRIFGVEPPDGLTWNQPIDRSLIPEGLTLVESLDKKNPIPTCRNCDTDYQPGSTYVITVDGFIVSDNIEVVDCRVIDDDFNVSDHNPVKLTFKLIQKSEAKRYELGPYKAIQGI